jgi:gas vesicle protein
MKIGRYIIGLLSGLTFGMLFAPKKGEELRKDICKKSSQSGAEGLKVLGEAFLQAGGEAWDEIKDLSEHEQVAAVMEASKAKLKEYLSALEDKGYDSAAIAQQKLEELADFARSKANQFKEKMMKEGNNGFSKTTVKGSLKKKPKAPSKKK